MSLGGLELRATTAVAVLRKGCIAIAGDGQVTVGQMVMKQGAEKVRKIAKGRAVVGLPEALLMRSLFLSDLRQNSKPTPATCGERLSNWRGIGERIECYVVSKR